MKFKKKLGVLAISLLLGLATVGGFMQTYSPTVHAAAVKAGIFTVNYVIQSSRNNKATVNVTINNVSTTAVTNWKIAWNFPSYQQKMTLLWNATGTQGGRAITINCLSSNATIPAKGSVSFGFNMTYSGTNYRPSIYNISYTRVASSTATPRVTTTPTATPRVTPTPSATTAPTPPATATTSKTIYTTSVNDNLNANDRVLFETYFKNIGYRLAGNNPDVSSTQLNTLLSRTDLGILYHTGHGYDSGIGTSGNNLLSVDQVSGVNVSTAIFATCLTLTSTTWKNKMNPSCNNIFGYTNYSYDAVDDDVVTKFASNVKSGKSMIQAWYNANIASSYLSDRWCGYVRENNSIVEYSARTGNTAKTAASTKAMNSAGTLKVATNLLADNSTYDSYFFKIRNSEIKVKGSKTHDSKFYNQTKAAGFLPKVAMGRDKAITIAKKWVSGSLPSDAVQDSVTQIVVTDASGTSTVVGQVVRYTRYIDGLAVRTNGSEDHLAILVNNNSVSSVSKLWPTLETKSKPGAIPANKMLGLNQAIEKASSKIAQLIKANKTIVITDAKPCYGTTKTGTLVPAYELIDSQGGRIIINAVTAELIF